MDRAKLLALAERCEQDKTHRVLRFSKCEARYKWVSIETDCATTSGTLLMMWNARHEIAACLRAIASQEQG